MSHRTTLRRVYSFTVLNLHLNVRRTNTGLAMINFISQFNCEKFLNKAITASLIEAVYMARRYKPESNMLSSSLDLPSFF